MKTRDEFLKELKKEVDFLMTKYESDADDNGRKLMIFKEHKELIEKYIVRLADSEYGIDECKQSLFALVAVCETRLEKITDILNDNQLEITDDMSVEQMNEMVATQFENLGIGTSAFVVNADILLHIKNVGLPSRSEIKAMIEKASKLDCVAFENIAVQIEDSMSEHDFELGCDKNGIKLFEELMAEQYPEFDAFLGR